MNRPPVKQRAAEILATKKVTAATMHKFDAVELAGVVTHMFNVLRSEHYTFRELESLEKLFDNTASAPIHACGRNARRRRLEHSYTTGLVGGFSTYWMNSNALKSSSLPVFLSELILSLQA